MKMKEKKIVYYLSHIQFYFIFNFFKRVDKKIKCHNILFVLSSFFNLNLQHLKF
jgi:hypothetical protein